MSSPARQPDAEVEDDDGGLGSFTNEAGDNDAGNAGAAGVVGPGTRRAANEDQEYDDEDFEPDSEEDTTDEENDSGR